MSVCFHQCNYCPIPTSSENLLPTPICVLFADRTKGFCRAYLLTPTYVHLCFDILSNGLWLLFNELEHEYDVFEWHNVRTSLRQCSAHLSHEVPLLLPLSVVPHTSLFPSFLRPLSALSMALSAQFEAAREGGPAARDGRRGFLRPRKPDFASSQTFLAGVLNASGL